MPDSVSAEATVAMAARWPRRYTVIILFALSTVLCYIDRVNISIAIIPLAHDKGYSDAERGLILSSFFWGYLWFQLPGGLLADRFGGKRVLGAGVALWSIATFLTPIATASFGLLLFMRAALGAGEAVNFPAIHSIAARWTPASERARAISLHLSGTALGTIIALLASPPIIIAFGWEAVFYVSGLLGLLWLAMWWWKAADWPEHSPGVSAAELSEIRVGRSEVDAAEAIPWHKICREPAVWAIVMAHLCNNFGYYILLLWLPSYLDQTFHVPLKDLGVMAVMPYVASFVVANCCGWLADNLQRRGMWMTAVRKTLVTIGFGLGAAVGMHDAVRAHGSAGGDTRDGSGRRHLDRAWRMGRQPSGCRAALRGNPDGHLQHFRHAARNHRCRRHRLHRAGDRLVFGRVLPRRRRLPGRTRRVRALGQR